MKLVSPYYFSGDVEGREAITSKLFNRPTIAEGSLERLREEVEHQEQLLRALVDYLPDEAFIKICRAVGLEVEP